MTIKEILKHINASNLDQQVKGILYSIIELKAKSEDESIWIMPNSEFTGLPMSQLPVNYIRASLAQGTQGYIKTPSYRSMLMDEAAKRNLSVCRQNIFS